MTTNPLFSGTMSSSISGKSIVSNSIVHRLRTGSNSIVHRLRMGSNPTIPVQQTLPAGGNIPKDLFEIMDLMSQLNGYLKTSEFYTEGPPELKKAPVDFVSNALSLLASLTRLIPMDNEAVGLRLKVLENLRSKSDVVKINSILSELIVQYADFQYKVQDLKRVSDTLKTKATKMNAWLTISRRSRKFLSCVVAALGSGAAIAVVTGSNIGFPPKANVPLGIFLSGIGLHTFNYTLWKNWNNNDVKRISLLTQVTDSIGILLARVQTMEKYAETGKTACGKLLEKGSPPVPAAPGKISAQPPIPAAPGKISAEPPVPTAQGKISAEPPVPVQGKTSDEPPVPAAQGKTSDEPPVPAAQGKTSDEPPVPAAHPPVPAAQGKISAEPPVLAQRKKSAGPPGDAAQRKALIVQMLNSIKGHSDELNECILYIKHAGVFVLKSANDHAT